jgi:hypothetical protein
MSLSLSLTRGCQLTSRTSDSVGTPQRGLKYLASTRALAAT